MEKPKVGDNTNSGSESVSALGKKSEGTGDGEEQARGGLPAKTAKYTPTSCCPIQISRSDGLGKGVCYSIVFIYTGAEKCNLKNNLGTSPTRVTQSEKTTLEYHSNESLTITDHPVQEYSGNHPSSDTQDNICLYKISPDEPLHAAALYCRNF